MAANGNVLAVALAALATALATVLGVLPFLVVRRPRQALRGVSSAAAAGFMVAAASRARLGGTRRERPPNGGRRRRRGGRHGRASARHRHARAPGARRFPPRRRRREGDHDRRRHDGAFVRGGDRRRRRVRRGRGARCLHHARDRRPQHPGRARIGLVLVPRGSGIAAAAGWSVVSSLPQPVMAVPAFLFVEAFSAALPVGLGFAAGAMAWMAVADLVPDARRDVAQGAVALSFVFAFGAMIGLQVLLAEV